MSYSVVNHEPAARSFNWRITQANLVGIPPGTAACFEHHFVCAPMSEVRGIRDPHMCTKTSNRPVDERPLSLDAARQECGILILRGHYHTETFKAVEVPRQCHGNSGAPTRVGC